MKRFVLLLLLIPMWAYANFEDVCVSKGHKIENCVVPQDECKLRRSANSACSAEVAQATKILIQHPPSRSMVHADATYFLAQAVGYRADVAYWIAAYNEVTDLTQYVPFDQCGNVASARNSGKQYITAKFNGFQRTNVRLEGPLYHYVLSFSPNGDGNDVHGAGGVQAVYPFHYPFPGYPKAIDDVYQGTLFNLRQWAMGADSSPGLLCAAGLTERNGEFVLQRKKLYEWRRDSRNGTDARGVHVRYADQRALGTEDSGR